MKRLEVLVKADGRDSESSAFCMRGGGGRQSIGYMGTLASDPLNDSVVHGIDSIIYLEMEKVDNQLVVSDKKVKLGMVFSDLVYTPKRGHMHDFSFGFR